MPTTRDTETTFFPRDIDLGEMWRLNFEEGWTFQQMPNHHGAYSVLAWRFRDRGIAKIATRKLTRKT